MAESTEQVLAKIRAAVEPGFRGTLTSRGIARSMVWRAGVVPPENQNLGQFLSQELLSYGYGLLRLGLTAKEMQLTDEAIDKAFELVGTSLEGVVRNGDPADASRGFYRVTAAAAYHLGKYSARAYSLLNQSLSDINITDIERGLAFLILRDFDGLFETALNFLQNSAQSDEALIERINDSQDDFSLDDALVVCLTETYLRALAAFVFSIRTGAAAGLEIAQTRLRDGEELAFHKGFVPIWWIYRLTRFLIDDLWTQSMRQLLPKESNDFSRWTELREKFLSSLAARSTAELELWPSQIEIASRVLNDRDDIVASLPTSAGKTRIAELCILRTLAIGKRVVFITPLRSLSAQTERTLKRSFSPLGFEVTALYGSSGNSAFDLDSLAKRAIVVGTPEKLDFALRNNPGLIDDVGLVVLDEGHMLGPSEREVRYEVLVQRLLRRPDAADRRLVCLSAMLPSGDQLHDFVSWIRSDEPGEPIQNSWRPTRQNFGEIKWKNGYAQYEMRVGSERMFIPRFVEKETRYGRRGAIYDFPSNQNDLVLASAWKLLADGLSVLIFCPEARSAGALAKHINEVAMKGFLSDLPCENTADLQKAIDIGIEWLGADHAAVQCLRRGVAIHYASLPHPFRRQLDVLIQQKQIRLIVSSPTLARGLNISASCVLFQEVAQYDYKTQKRKLISPEVFANVAGRAGRAFVDVDGQVLGVCFDNKRVKEWEEVLKRQTTQKLSSGLLTLIGQLIVRFRHTIPSGHDPVEYILNNSRIWESPSNDNDDIAAWQTDLAILDTALLSLIGDQDCATDDLASTLDLALHSSLFQKSLGHYSIETQNRVKAVLESRAKHIWANSSPKQRKGYFFSGLGLNAGRFLDEHAAQLNEAVLAAEEALRTQNADDCVTRLLDIAKTVFTIEPFKPKKQPPNWERIAQGWLQGEPMSDIHKLSKDATSFIEDGLIYRLVWAVEAIRARSRANEEQLFSENPSPLGVAIETGTVSVAMSLLLQAGLPSRSAAMKALEDSPGLFDTPTKMQQWLFSVETQAATGKPDWPTYETSKIWKDFISQQTPPPPISQVLVGKFFHTSFSDQTETPQVGDDVMIIKRRNDRQPRVYSPDMKLLGTIQINSNLPGNVAFGRVEPELMIRINID